MERIFISRNLLFRWYVLVSILALNQRCTFFASPPQTLTQTPPPLHSGTPCLQTWVSKFSAMPVFELHRLRLLLRCQQLTRGVDADRSPSRNLRPCQPEKSLNRLSLYEFFPTS